MSPASFVARLRLRDKAFHNSQGGNDDAGETGRGRAGSPGRGGSGGAHAGGARVQGGGSHRAPSVGGLWPVYGDHPEAVELRRRGSQTGRAGPPFSAGAAGGGVALSAA